MGKTAEKADPKLWGKVKQQVTGEDKGGKPGQWSARKAQLAVQTYKSKGGRYKGEKSDDNHLSEWTREEWGTRSGAKSGETGERYLPKAARNTLSKTEYDRTTAKKRADSAKGEQFSAQPKDIARKTGSKRAAGDHEEVTRAELLERAARKGIRGRSRMNKASLQQALGAAS